ncbi:hypothetical protein [Haloarcula nitratireducens]|uniref:Uncharacterized protein n=1 Tax=Haloarcula nitratireducens TaxID=2487749 RepID=A0AAW4PBV2_9EURY|nr:hypothetical protein [Halomicroarcula nitratireducens]MBX0295150.1 hypothetical protein [Halomicroarcula nitratireducens]
MSDLSPLDRRMRWPTVAALVVGFGLGALAVFVPRTVGGEPVPWTLALPFGGVAALFLYGVMYRNLSARAE